MSLAHSEGLVAWKGPADLFVMRMMSNGRPEICISIHLNTTWEVAVCELKVPEDCNFFAGIPSTLQLPHFSRMVQILESLNTCVGNSDFSELVKSKHGSRGQIPVRIASRDVYCTYPKATIRHEKCSLLVQKPDDRCDVCRIHRVDLRSLSLRIKEKGPVPITTRNDTMSAKQLRAKAALLQAQKRSLQKRNQALASKMQEIMEIESIRLSPHQNATFQGAFEECDKIVRREITASSPALLLWEQQKESMRKGRAMRWHPAVIRFCIAIQSKSSAAYNLLRESGFMNLPHPTTLHPYSHFATPTSGFNSDLVKRIISDHIFEGMPDHQRDVSLMFDEMKVKAGLVYSQGTGSIVGFVDVGSISNEILAFEQRCKGEKDVPVATHVLVLMVRGIFTALRAPIGYYPSVGVSSHQLYPCLLEAIVLLENAGFVVRSLVCDGASPNRKYYRMNRDEDDQSSIVHCTRSPAQPSRYVYFICDVPHLLKTTRNNFENSGYHNKTRHLHFKGQDIKWSQLLMLYEWDIGLDRTSPGLRRLHKLTYEHLHLTPALRMRVYMAVQVLSSSVANAMKALGRHDTKSTELFISYFDKFFDCLNVSNPHDATHQQKPVLQPYKSPDDWRFEWLQKDFLGFLEEWEEEVASHQHVEAKERLKMCFSRETLEGLKITVRSFVKLAPLLLKSPGVEYLLSEKFNQDPLEMHFSKQRGAGGCNDNPSVEQVGYNMFSFYVASKCLKASRRANMRQVNIEETALDSAPLPKKPKRK